MSVGGTLASNAEMGLEFRARDDRYLSQVSQFEKGKGVLTGTVPHTHTHTHTYTHTHTPPHTLTIHATGASIFGNRGILPLF